MNKPIVAIIDVPGANSRNLAIALRAVSDVVLLQQPDQLPQTTRLLCLPGVGFFQTYVEFLRQHGWHHYLQQPAMPVLGICAGYHALCQHSEESPGYPGLGIFDAQVIRLPNRPDLPWGKVPHTGRRQISNSVGDALLSQAFFVHSYGVVSHDKPSIRQTLTIGGEDFVVAQAQKNWLGLQYHPELSGPAATPFFAHLVSGEHHGPIWPARSG